jgi:hypothetical protein
VQNVWVFVGIGVVIAVVVLLSVVAHGRAKRRKIRNHLGLPRNSRLSPKHALAFQEFKDTDVRLKTSFPTMPDPQRQSMAREVLRHKGLLPKRNQVEPLRRLRMSEIADQLSSGGHVYTYGWNRVVPRDHSAEAWMAEGRTNTTPPLVQPLPDSSVPSVPRSSAIEERVNTAASRPWPMVHPI